ncbi:hypothetical protein Tco_1475100 [Tanacetum coccineum]
MELGFRFSEFFLIADVNHSLWKQLWTACFKEAVVVWLCIYGKRILFEDVITETIEYCLFDVVVEFHRLDKSSKGSSLPLLKEIIDIGFSKIAESTDESRIVKVNFDLELIPTCMISSNLERQRSPFTA